MLVQWLNGSTSEAGKIVTEGVLMQMRRQIVPTDIDWTTWYCTCSKQRYLLDTVMDVVAVAGPQSYVSGWSIIHSAFMRCVVTTAASKSTVAEILRATHASWTTLGSALFEDFERAHVELLQMVDSEMRQKAAMPPRASQ